MQIKIFVLEKQEVIFEDLRVIHYKDAWDYQEALVKKNLEIKSLARNAAKNGQAPGSPFELEADAATGDRQPDMVFPDLPTLLHVAQAGSLSPA